MSTANGNFPHLRILEKGNLMSLAVIKSLTSESSSSRWVMASDEAGQGCYVDVADRSPTHELYVGNIR